MCYGLRISQYREYVGEVVIYFKCPIKRMAALNYLRDSETYLFFATWFEDDNGLLSNFEEFGDE